MALAAGFLAASVSSNAAAGENASYAQHKWVGAKSVKKKRSGLAGSEGNVRRKVMFNASMTGGCGGMHKRYIAASGHSAFASTPINYFYGTNICAVGLNAPSTKAAEDRALASCRAGLKKYKSAGEQGPKGPCLIFMSK